MDWLVTQLFDSISRVASLGMPVLFIHGSSDCVVPVFTAQRMYDHRAAGPKSLLIVPGDPGTTTALSSAGSSTSHRSRSFWEG